MKQLFFCAVKKDFTIGLPWHHVTFWLYLTSLCKIAHFAIESTLCAQCFVDYIDLEIKLTNAVTERCSIKQVVLEISQNSQENICAKVPF